MPVKYVTMRGTNVLLEWKLLGKLILALYLLAQLVSMLIPLKHGAWGGQDGDECLAWLWPDLGHCCPYPNPREQKSCSTWELRENMIDLYQQTADLMSKCAAQPCCGACAVSDG